MHLQYESVLENEVTRARRVLGIRKYVAKFGFMNTMKRA